MPSEKVVTFMCLVSDKWFKFKTNLNWQLEKGFQSTVSNRQLSKDEQNLQLNKFWMSHVLMGVDSQTYRLSQCWRAEQPWIFSQQLQFSTFTLGRYRICWRWNEMSIRMKNSRIYSLTPLQPKHDSDSIIWKRSRIRHFGRGNFVVHSQAKTEFLSTTMSYSAMSWAKLPSIRLHLAEFTHIKWIWSA